MAATTNNTSMRETHHLGLLRKGDSAIVTGLRASGSAEESEIQTRLLELGFAPGERVEIIAVSFPHRDPMAVRVGSATFALRRHEAAMIQIEPASL